MGYGGATGVGVLGEGGISGGVGVTGIGTVNNAGVSGAGQGSGVGVKGTGGATGNGVVGVGGSTSGIGVLGTGTGNNAGVRGNGQGTGAGVLGYGGSTNGIGVFGTGTGTGAGVSGTGGTTGNGVVGVGGSTNGIGVLGTGTGNNAGVSGAGGPKTDVVAISSGSFAFSSLALKSDGSVWAWGENSWGQLGDGTNTGRSSPVQVIQAAGTVITKISNNIDYSLLLKNDGTVWAFGQNDYGQLGDGTYTPRNTPVQVIQTAGTPPTYFANAIAIAAGTASSLGPHSLALKSDGTVWAWGRNNAGQLGDGTTASRNTPVQVIQTAGTPPTYFADAIAIAAGGSFSLALKSDGTVWAWGLGGYLGDGTGNNRVNPVQVQTAPSTYLTNIVSVSAGWKHSLAVKSDGTVWAWGYSQFGELGDGTTTAQTKSRAAQVSGLSGVNVIAVSAGQSHSLALKSDGTVLAWGWNFYGQLGDGTQVSTGTPTQVSGLTNVIAIQASNGASFALKSDGTVWAWGRNVYGRLGDGTTQDRLTPVLVKDFSGGAGVVGVGGVNSVGGNFIAGTGSSLALRASGDALVNNMTLGLGGGGLAENSALGYSALLNNTTGSKNTAVGYNALLSNSTGADNTVVGAYALDLNTVGSQNTAIGAAALGANTTGSNNTATGWNALLSNSTGVENTAIGSSALDSNTTGSYNTATGHLALASNVNGTINTAIGHTALEKNTGGYENTATGHGALKENIGGFRNTALGVNALRYMASGNTNTALGYAALTASADYTNCTAVGHNAQVNGSNQVQLGDSSTNTYVYGTVQNRSDQRDKADIQDTKLGLEFIRQLRPVDYRWDYREDYREIVETEVLEKGADGVERTKIELKVVEKPKDGSKKRTRFHHGLIAQEVKSVMDKMNTDFGGYQDHSVKGGLSALTLGYEELIAPLIKAVQELAEENRGLKERILALEEKYKE